MTRASKTKSLVHWKKLGKQEHGECGWSNRNSRTTRVFKVMVLPNSDCKCRVDLQTLPCGGHLFLQLQGVTLAEAWFFSNSLVSSLARFEPSHRSNMMIERNSKVADTEG